MVGIYSICCSHNGKRYIGSSVSVQNRKRTHFRELNKGIHSISKMQNDWNKYGKESFIFQPLLICSNTDLTFYEQRAIDTFDSIKNGYNKYKATDPPLRGLNANTSLAIAHVASLLVGRKLSKEHCKNISLARTGLKYSEEVKSKMCGRVVSSETKQRISDACKGRKLTEEHKLNISKALSGRVMPEEERKAHIVYPTEETRAKLLKSWESEERHQKMSLYQLEHSSRRGKVVSVETRRKMRESRIGKIPWNKGLKEKY
jgi:group I intron endonuclease